MKVSDFDFELPDELIAQYPLARRDASRMLVVDGAALQDKHIADLISYIRAGDVVVFNNSRVIPARFDAVACGDVKYEITLHTAVSDVGANDVTPAQAGAPNNAAGSRANFHSPLQWWGLCKKFNKLNIGDTLTLDDGTRIEIKDINDESGLLIEFQCADVFDVLERVGKMPLPPYMKREEELNDRARYQTVYSAPLGSMAAPTAGLHFTDELLGAIKNAGAEIVNITLHVGAGTWMPVKTDDTSGHKMHSEWGEITQEQADIINEAKARGGRIIAVGTTSLRLLESAAIEKGKLQSFRDSTDIFITPGYEFKIVDMMLTNFHLPKSTLFMLVSAFAGLPEIKAAYAHAVHEKYRFFSYGDCCLLFKK
ncbi:MAG: tRNA preQ1(34) S-adenosylmethionine ribosyltransferase-isomerase QueA [Alphaproteobacteria bacterium]|nr:tRNA preQ1(34) S-adenosylmethionine ribosyltransferase-isomerase QueA [Alphaproteobacteria bacterium]